MSSSLDTWVKAPKPKPRPIKHDEAMMYYDSFVRGRKLRALEDKHPNLKVEFVNGSLRDDEWYYIVDVQEYGMDYHIIAYALRTIDKATAVRRAYGWGIRDKDGPVWPPEPGYEPDEPHVPDVDEAAYFNYWRF